MGERFQNPSRLTRAFSFPAVELSEDCSEFVGEASRKIGPRWGRDPILQAERTVAGTGEVGAPKNHGNRSKFTASTRTTTITALKDKTLVL
jgi:hypothetical protein